MTRLSDPLKNVTHVAVFRGVHLVNTNGPDTRILFGANRIARSNIDRGPSTTSMVAWMSTSGPLLSPIFAPDLTVHAQPQAYTRLADRLYLFENLDGSGFKAELPVDEDGIVLDYPDLFRRVT